MKKLGVIVFGALMVVGTLVCISAAGASDAELISFEQTVKQLASGVACVLGGLVGGVKCSGN